jgi:hypothetical protein
VANKFYIYQNGNPILITNKNLEWLLAGIAIDFGIDREFVFDIPFRNNLFGRCWRELEEAKPKVEETMVQDGLPGADIFSKIDKHSTKPVSPVSQVWRQVAPAIYNVEFYRFQNLIGADKFIVQVLK